MALPPTAQNTGPPLHDSAPDAQQSGQDDLENRSIPLVSGIRTSSFWIAIILPAGHVPLLATGLTDGRETALFLTLLILNVLALYIGHSHRG